MAENLRTSKLVRGLFFLIIASLVSLAGCEWYDPGSTCSYDLGAYGDISSTRVFYPCEIEDSGKLYNATTLSGGNTNSKEDMYWLAEHLRSKGNVVFAISAVDNNSVPGYTSAQMSGFDLMGIENDNPDSVVYNKIKKKALMGFSMGGGAVLNAANTLGSDLDAVVACAAYNPQKELGNVTAPTMMIMGQNDPWGNPAYSEKAYTAIPDTTTKCLVEMADFPHLNWIYNFNASGKTPKLMITDWLELNLNGNTEKIDTFNNPPDNVALIEHNL